LIPLLVSAGHDVVASTRTTHKTDSLGALGAQPVVVDGLDRAQVMKAVLFAKPDVIVSQMTALAGVRDIRRFDDEFALTNRLRTEGTAHLLEAARAAAVRKFIAQSYTGWPNVREGGKVKSEDDPLDPTPPKAMKRSLDAIRHLEAMISGLYDMVGIVLRYGSLYGPGTSIAQSGDIVEMVSRRRFPIFGDGHGVWSFLHIDDAARATLLATERGLSGIYNIVDDEPAEVSVWLSELARVLGAKPPYPLPAWLGRLAIGEAGLSMMTRIRGSSNAKARRVLDWQPMFASYRDGFRSLVQKSVPSADDHLWAKRGLGDAPLH
jgi:nucleoside-diphosphate-sugar epimerase